MYRIHWLEIEAVVIEVDYEVVGLDRVFESLTEDIPAVLDQAFKTLHKFLVSFS